MAETPTIDSVTTFVATGICRTIEEVVASFGGRHTPRTLAAARRIRAAEANRGIKVPCNLLRQLWRATGGWKEGALKSGWGNMKPDEGWKVVKFGDLEVIMSPASNSYRPAILKYRGLPVARVGEGYGDWLDVKLVSGMAATLGVSYQPPT